MRVDGTKIVDQKIQSTTWLKDLLSQWDYFPFYAFQDKVDFDLYGYLLEEISEIDSEPNNFVLSAVEKGNPTGCAIFSELPWDSGYFQKRMGAVKYLILEKTDRPAELTAHKLLAQGIETARKRGWDFLLCKCNCLDFSLIHALESQGFLMMDTMLDFVYDYEKPVLATIPVPMQAPGFLIRLATKADREELMLLSRRSFKEHFGRFHADLRISSSQAIGIYEQWLDSSCKGWADWIVVAEKQGEIAGYSVWKKPSAREVKYGIPMGHYSIGAIGPDYQNQGLFRILTYEGMKILERHCGFIEGPTHISNFGVQRGYTSLGWKICGGRHAFHKWLT